MEYRTLGGGGAAVSHLALGTMTFGGETDRDGAFTQLDTFLAAGGTLVDTADVYTGGTSEEIIGAWLADRPADVTERVVLATKGRFPTSGEPNGVGLSRRHLTRALDASLTRLGVEAVDLYQVHAWDPWTPIEETLAALDSFVQAGKAHYVGLSNFTGWQLQKTVDAADAMGLTRPVTLQPQYSLLVREIEWEIVPAALENGLGLLPWSPLGGGWLSGKYQRDTVPTGATRLGENPERGVERYAGLESATNDAHSSA
jgi:aryl-alcohol dehydrogenase-like predicted oxidoreductase